MANKDFVVTTGIDGDGIAFVTLKWGEEVGIIRPASARTFALGILQACEQAEQDQVLLGWFRFIKFDEPQAMRMISVLRQRRYPGMEHPPSGRAQASVKEVEGA